MSIQTINSDYWKNYYATHKEERKAQARAYYWRNHDACLNRKREFSHDNREKLHQCYKRYYQNNKEKCLNKSKEYLKQHPEKRRQYAENYRESHRDAYRKYQTEYQHSAKRQLYRKNPSYQAKQQIITSRYRARKNQLEATLTLEQWEAIKRIYNYRCAYCGKGALLLTQDHVVPVINGGSYIASNIVPACLSCNSAKGAGSPPILPSVRLLL